MGVDDPSAGGGDEEEEDDDEEGADARDMVCHYLFFVLVGGIFCVDARRLAG
jgi:hypothetical protein